MVQIIELQIRTRAAGDTTFNDGVAADDDDSRIKGRTNSRNHMDQGKKSIAKLDKIFH